MTPTLLLIVSALQLTAMAQTPLRTLPLYYKNEYPYFRSETLRLDGARLGKCFATIVQASADPSLDVEKSRYPGFLEYLTASTTRFETGYSEELKSWILAQPDHSLAPHLVFQESLRLNQGRVFEALITLHELFRREARWYRDWMKYPSSYPAMRAFFNKLIDIRGDLEERGDAFHGDHRGTWYRIWGTMLHAMWMAHARQPKVWLRIKGRIAASIAETSKPWIMYGNEPDPRKTLYNRAGYETIWSMLTELQNPPPFVAETENCDSAKYLRN